MVSYIVYVMMALTMSKMSCVLMMMILAVGTRRLAVRDIMKVILMMLF